MLIPEMMTISILFYQSNHRNFKYFYYNHLLIYLRKEVSALIIYRRFSYLLKNLFFPLFVYLIHNKGIFSEVGFIDSTKIQVLYNKRMRRNKIFAKEVRNHWSIENKLHWQLGVNFRVDLSRVLNLLQKDKSSKVSLRKRRFIASCHKDYLLALPEM